MQRGDESLDSLTTNAWQRRNEIVRRFEDAWRAGRRPAIEDFLPPEEPDRHGVLVELVFVDMERRLDIGDAVRVETYLNRYPELQRDTAVALELIVGEYQLRRSRGEAVGEAEYLQRFPDFRDDLRRAAARGCIKRRGGHGSTFRQDTRAGGGSSSSAGRRRPQPALRHPGPADGLHQPRRAHRRHERLGAGQDQALGADPRRAERALPAERHALLEALGPRSTSS